MIFPCEHHATTADSRRSNAIRSVPSMAGARDAAARSSLAAMVSQSQDERQTLIDDSQMCVILLDGLESEKERQHRRQAPVPSQRSLSTFQKHHKVAPRNRRNKHPACPRNHGHPGRIQWSPVTTASQHHLPDGSAHPPDRHTRTRVRHLRTWRRLRLSPQSIRCVLE